LSATLRVANPGALTLVQDSGRLGFQRYGVSVSGAVDAEALFIGNLLAGNAADAAALEVTFGGAEFVFESDTIAAIAGADLNASLDGTPLPVWESFLTPAGSVLRFAAPVSGLRAYLACAGGIATPPVLGSRSTHTGSRLGGLDGGPLKANETLPLGEPSSNAAPGRRLPDDLRPGYSRELTVRVIPGPQDDAFTAEGIETFYSSPYTVTEKSDRQGVRLDGPKIEVKNGRYDIVSDAVVFGSVQVPGDGMPIVLLADRQTTGGYAKIGVVATVDLPRLAQAAPAMVIRFVQTSVQEAQQALRERRQALLGADLLSGVAERDFQLSIGGSHNMKLSYRPAALATSGGTLVSVRSGAALLTVRAEDATNR
jgi:antagonist of KipI